MSNKKTRREALRHRHAAAPFPWPLALVAGGILLIVGVVAFAVWQATGSTTPKVPVEVTGAPKLKLDKEQVDLGTVRLGQTVEVTFNVANTGDKQLRFTEPPYVEVVEGC